MAGSDAARPLELEVEDGDEVAAKDVAMHVALASSMASIVLTAASSARAHHRRGSVLWPTVAWMVPGVLLGGWLADRKSLDPESSHQLLGVAAALGVWAFAAGCGGKVVVDAPVGQGGDNGTGQGGTGQGGSGGTTGCLGAEANVITERHPGVLAVTGGGGGDMSITAVKTSFSWCHGFTLPYHAAARGADFAADGSLSNQGVLDRVRRVAFDVVRYAPPLRAAFEQARALGRVVEAGVAGTHA